MMNKVVELNAVQIEQLKKVADLDWSGNTLEHWLLDIGSGRIDAWVPDRAENAVVITQIINRPAGRELALLAIAGRGILKVARQAVEDLVEVARVNGCSWISAEAFRPNWHRPATRLGFRPVATTYLMELGNGQRG